MHGVQIPLSRLTVWEVAKELIVCVAVTCRDADHWQGGASIMHLSAQGCSFSTPEEGAEISKTLS